MPRIIQVGWFPGTLLGKLASRLMKVGIPLVKNYSAPLATMAYASAIDGAIQRKIRGKGVLRAGKGITLVI